MFCAFMNNNFIQDRNDGTNANMTGNRKRSRDEESCEFMPLSKRINNLHINNNLGAPSQESLQSSNGLVGNNCGHTSQNGMIHYSNIPQSSSGPNLTDRPQYEPGMTSSQSPYYFDNKLLFELHLERVQRTGQQFPF